MRPTVDLDEAISILGQAAELIRDSELDHGTNLKRIGKALVELFDIQRDIYMFCPELERPEFKKK
jgi:cob(I)alamin adenosyltransferase